jgi:hypothetical protein
VALVVSFLVPDAEPGIFHSKFFGYENITFNSIISRDFGHFLLRFI